MFWLVLAAATALASPQTATPPVNVLPLPTEGPRFVARPSENDIAAAYPHTAANVGMGGTASLHCDVGRGGQVEKCQVASESPSGVGFGGAAVRLSRFFRVDPQSAAAQAGTLDMSLDFPPLAGENEIVVRGPWIVAPTFADVAAAYPDIGGGETGLVYLRCELERDGSVRACKVLYAQPYDRDFDTAALKLTDRFQMRLDPSVLKSHLPMQADVLVRLAAPYKDEAAKKQIANPVWLSGPDSNQLAALFPAAARAKGVASGVGTAECAVKIDGALAGCQPWGEGDPPGLGFSEAAAKAASQMRMAPWTSDGGPVDGAVVRLPIRFAQSAP